MLLSSIACLPTATLLSPVVSFKALLPTAVLPEVVVAVYREVEPIATLSAPDVRAFPAKYP